jgi:hypothetical protein
VKWLRKLLRRRRDAHSLDPVRPMVRPEDRAAASLERRRAELTYYPENGLLRDDWQQRLPSLLRKQAG